MQAATRYPLPRFPRKMSRDERLGSGPLSGADADEASALAATPCGRLDAPCLTSTLSPSFIVVYLSKNIRSVGLPCTHPKYMSWTSTLTEKLRPNFASALAFQHMEASMEASGLQKQTLQDISPLLPVFRPHHQLIYILASLRSAPKGVEKRKDLHGFISTLPRSRLLNAATRSAGDGADGTAPTSQGWLSNRKAACSHWL